MGVSSVYLLPEEPQSSPHRYRDTVVSVLTEMEIIRLKPSDGSRSFWPGSKSLEPFENSVGWKAGFEYCAVYGEQRMEVVPQDPSVSPTCPACSADVADQYYEIVNGVEEHKEEMSYESTLLACPNCQRQWRIDQLTDDVGVFLTQTYANFDDVPGPMRDSWLAVFNAVTGIRHRKLEYWYT